jgi:hypothetical protein
MIFLNFFRQMPPQYQHFCHDPILYQSSQFTIFTTIPPSNAM